MRHWTYIGDKITVISASRKLCSFKIVIWSLHKFKNQLKTRYGPREHTADQPSMFVLFNIWTGLHWYINIHLEIFLDKLLNHKQKQKKKSFTYVSTGQSSIHSSPRELLNTLLITHSKGKLLVGSTCPLTTSEYFNFKESNGKNKQTNKKSVICILSQFRMTKIYQHPVIPNWGSS